MCPVVQVCMAAAEVRRCHAFSPLGLSCFRDLRKFQSKNLKVLSTHSPKFIPSEVHLTGGCFVLFLVLFSSPAFQ